MSNLLHQKCRAFEGGEPMSAPVIHDHLTQVSGWQLKEGAIEKSFGFKNYFETISFVNALAWICNTEDHHPAEVERGELAQAAVIRMPSRRALRHSPLGRPGGLMPRTRSAHRPWPRR